ncbi:MAG: DNA repair protein RecO [Proteobacteria bacterium]|nr:DNA repair protein RecO [Pseudomonadota bacterium]
MSKQTQTYEGLVLKNINFKDSDKIYTIFIRVLGKVSAKARGIRKFSSKRLSSLDSLNLVKVGLVGDHELKTITEVILIDSFKNVKQDFNKLKTAIYLIEIVSNYLNESSEYVELFDLLIKCLKRLEETSYSDSRIENFFEYQFLKMIGYELNFYDCVFCKKTILESIKFNFNFEKGGIVCENCSSSFNFFSNTQKNALFLLNNLKIQSEMDFVEVDKILKSYINSILPETPKSNRFFNR